MPTAAQAAKALGTVHITKGRVPRVKRYGTREWVDAPVGTPLYGGDRVRTDEGAEGSVRHAGGDFIPLRGGSLVEMERPRVKAKRKKREIVSGEANFGRKD